MKRLFLLLTICVLTTMLAQAQTTDSTATVTQAPAARKFTRGDSLYLAKLNSSGNIMIAAGVGLSGAGGYLIYNGHKVYTTPIDQNATAGQQQESERQNRKQGTIYMAVGGVCIAGGLVLTALGAKNKVEFKKQKKRMTLQSGLLDNGNLGLALTF